MAIRAPDGANKTTSYVANLETCREYVLLGVHPDYYNITCGGEGRLSGRPLLTDGTQTHFGSVAALAYCIAGVRTKPKVKPFAFGTFQNFGKSQFQDYNLWSHVSIDLTTQES